MSEILLTWTLSLTLINQQECVLCYTSFPLHKLVCEIGPRFAYRIFYQSLNKKETYHLTTLKMEIDWSNG